MALMTTAEVKSVLRITDTTYDTDIAFFLPLVEDDLVEYLSNSILDGYVYRETASDFAFVRGDSDTHDYITDKSSEFVEKGFLAGMDIAIEGGFSNVGLYTIDSAAAGKLVLSEFEELVSQDQDDTSDDNYIGSVRISRVKWPKAIKLAAAKMVWALIEDAKPSSAKSESLDDYSITYIGSHAYPDRVVRLLDNFRKVRML
jgi:hypothetical protein